MSNTAQKSKKPRKKRLEKLADGKHFSNPERPEVIARKIKYSTQGEGPSKLGFNAIIIRHPRRHCIGYAEYVLPDTLVIEVEALPPLSRRKKAKGKKSTCSCR